MSKTAIMVDGGFYRKLARKHWGKNYGSAPVRIEVPAKEPFTLEIPSI